MAHISVLLPLNKRISIYYMFGELKKKSTKGQFQNFPDLDFFLEPRHISQHIKNRNV